MYTDCMKSEMQEGQQKLGFSSFLVALIGTKISIF